MITFTQTWPPIAGACAAAAMIAAWWLSRLATPRRGFPPLLWMQLAVKRQPRRQRRLSPRQHLAFAVACMLLLGLLFGQPMLGTKPDVHDGVIIILDGSLSMATQHPKPLFQEGRRKAGLLIRALDPEARANLAIAGGAITWAFKETSAGFSRQPLWQLLENAEPDHTGGNMMKALAAGVAKLSRVNAHEKVLHVISDFQRASWPLKPLPVHQGIRIIRHAVGAPCTHNAAIHADPHACFTGFAGEPMRLSVRLANHDPQEKPIRLSWSINRRSMQTDDLILPGLGETQTTGRFTFPAPGIYECTASFTPADALPEDNTLSMTIRILKAGKVLVAADAPSIRALLIQAMGGRPDAPVTALPFTAGMPLHDQVLLVAGHQPAAIKAARRAHRPVILFSASAAIHAKAGGPQGNEETGPFQLSGTFQGCTQDSLPALASVRTGKRLRPASSGHVLSLFSDQLPAAACFPQHRLIAVFFDLTLESGGLLQNQESAVVLLGELVRLGMGMDAPILTSGMPATVLLPQKGFRFFSPDEQEFFPGSSPVDDLAKVTLPGFGASGFFRIWHDQRLHSVLPVNPPRAESSPEQNKHLLADSVGNGDGEAGMNKALAAQSALAPGLLTALIMAAMAWFLMATRSTTREAGP